VSNLATLPVTNSTPVANLEAELCLIGALLYDNKVAKGLAHLAPDHFYETLHGQIWGAALELIADGESADPVTVSAALGQPEGMVATLASLVADAYTGGARSHADLVVNASRLRHAIGLADDIRAAAREGADAFNLISQAEREFSRMVQEAAPPSTNLIDARSSAYVTLDEIDREAEQGRDKGYMTGLRCFDRRMRGLRPGWLVVVAGRPSMGKTALARAAAFGPPSGPGRRWCSSRSKWPAGNWTSARCRSSPTWPATASPTRT
jgi:replicative DNA helicase